MSRQGHRRLQPEIQGLRGIAVLLVVLYHAGVSALPGGFVGVDVFFVISGFLITGILFREVEATGRVNWGAFLCRRARRLLPASFAMLLVVVVASFFVYPSLERDLVLSAARASALYVANIWFAGRAIDYLGGGGGQNPLLHMWSLAVEEQFYLVWPLLLGLVGYFAKGSGFRRAATVTGGCVCAISLAACVWTTWVSQPWAFFGTPLRAWEFGAGALVYLAGPRIRAWSVRSLQIAGLAGTILLLAGVLVLDHAALFPGLWAILPVGGTALVLVSISTPNGSPAVAKFLSFRWLTHLGDVSYSWYLWHWPFLVLSGVYANGLTGVQVFAVVAVSLLVAEISYFLVENPLRASSPENGDRLLWIGGGAALVTIGLGGALTLMMAHLRDAGIPDAERPFVQARGDVPDVYAQGCHAPFHVTDAKECVYGSVLDSSGTVVLFGDSHAAQWQPALAALASARDWRIVSITKSGCPSVDITVHSTALRRSYVECDEWRKSAFRRIAELRPALIVIGNSSRYGRSGEWGDGLHRTLEALGSNRTAARIVVLRDTPWPGFDVPTCLARAHHQGRDFGTACRYSQREALSAGQAVFEAETLVASTRSGVSVVDMTRAICQDEHCPTIEGGLVRFSDANHLTASFSRQLSTALGEKMSVGQER